LSSPGAYGIKSWGNAFTLFTIIDRTIKKKKGGKKNTIGNKKIRREKEGKQSDE
jgi:hypothetical protein